MFLFVRTLGVVALATLVGGTVLAAPPQLDLPDDGARREADASDGGDGVEIRTKSTGDLAPKPEGTVQKPALDVGPAPSDEPAAPATPGGVPGESEAGAPGVDVPLLPAPASTPGSAAAAGALLDELRTIAAPDDPRLFDVTGRLLEQGAAGLSAARAALQGDGVGLVLGGAQVLFAGGEAADRDQVVQRARRKLPVRAGPALLMLIAERDPVRASPELWISLLDHPQGLVREAAARRLSPVLGPAHVAPLAARLRAGDSETRRLALESLAAIDDPLARNLIFDSLGDGAAKVASRAAQLLAVDDTALPRLLELAFSGEPRALETRRRDYARLALVEREDRRAVAAAGPERVPALLVSIESEEPLERGAAALLLSGIGFRAEESRGFAWLDRSVPHELVRIIGGDVFHRDFSALAELAQRRLALLSGQTFGSNGAAWQTWWIDSYEGFRAHRAVLDVGEAETLGLVVRYKEGLPTMRVLRFLGPAAPPDPPGAPVLGHTIRLSAAQASDLARRLAQEGVFGVQRLPSPSALFTASSRELEVHVAEQAKRFVLPAETPPDQDPWIDRLSSTFIALAEENRWQRYPGHANPAELWLAEAPWWDEPHTQPERDERLKDLVLTDLGALSTFERGPGLDELERLAVRGALGPQDFESLIRLLAEERYFGDRVGRLVRLAILSVRGPDSRIPAELATEMVRLLASSYPAEAEAEVVEVLAATDPEVTRQTARSDVPLLRALAAAGLARRATPADRELLGELLRDPSPDVEAAAVLAHATAGITEAADDLLFRARMAEPRVRSAALRAIGVLRPDGAIDALVQGLADTAPAVQVAAADGLAELRDPASASLLVSLLGRGSRSPLYEPAARGLRALGVDGHEALLRSAKALGGSASRDAALLLAEDLVPDVASVLIRLLSSDSGDARIATELCVLTCVDMRRESDPARAWEGWWSTVRHDDSLAWFRAACERQGTPAPEHAAFASGGTRSARLYLIDRMGGAENHVAEHARRLFGVLVGGDVGDLPTRGPLRDEFLDGLRARFAGEEP